MEKEAADRKNKELSGNNSNNSSVIFQEQRLNSFEDLYNVKKRIKLDDLFSLKEDNKNQKIEHLLVFGRAGIGKTTFMRYLAFLGQLSNDDQDKPTWLQPYELVIYIPLQHLMTYKHKNELEKKPPPLIPTMEMLGNFVFSVFEKENALGFRKLLCYLKGSFLVEGLQEKLQNDLSTLLLEFEDKILWLLDGYDETRNLLIGPDSNQKRLGLCLLSQTHTILSSRPAVISDIYPQSEERGCRTLEVMGFRDKNIPKYIDHYFGISNDSASDHEKELGQQLLYCLEANHLHWALCHVPINLAIFCFFWKEMDAQERQVMQAEHVMKQFQLNSITMLYSRVVNRLYKKYLGKYQPVDYERYIGKDKKNYFGHHDKNHTVLYSFHFFLSSLALYGMKNRKTTFNSEDLKNIYKILNIQQSSSVFFQNLQQLGILSLVGENLETAVSISFFHLTFQEYYAACALSDLLQNQGYCSDDNSTILPRDFIHKNKFYSSMQIVWPFLTGLLSRQVVAPNEFLAFFESLDDEVKIRKAGQSALSYFIDVINDAPFDLSGQVWLALVVRCLDEMMFMAEKKSLDDLSFLYLDSSILAKDGLNWWQKSATALWVTVKQLVSIRDNSKNFYQQRILYPLLHRQLVMCPSQIEYYVTQYMSKQIINGSNEEKIKVLEKIPEIANFLDNRFFLWSILSTLAYSLKNDNQQVREASIDAIKKISISDPRILHQFRKVLLSQWSDEQEALKYFALVFYLKFNVFCNGRVEFTYLLQSALEDDDEDVKKAAFSFVNDPSLIRDAQKILSFIKDTLKSKSLQKLAIYIISILNLTYCAPKELESIWPILNEILNINCIINDPSLWLYIVKKLSERKQFPEKENLSKILNQLLTFLQSPYQEDIRDQSGDIIDELIVNKRITHESPHELTDRMSENSKKLMQNTLNTIFNNSDQQRLDVRLFEANIYEILKNGNSREQFTAIFLAKALDLKIDMEKISTQILNLLKEKKLVALDIINFLGDSIIIPDILYFFSMLFQENIDNSRIREALLTIFKKLNEENKSKLLFNILNNLEINLSDDLNILSDNKKIAILKVINRLDIKMCLNFSQNKFNLFFNEKVLPKFLNVLSNSKNNDLKIAVLSVIRILSKDAMQEEIFNRFLPQLLSHLKTENVAEVKSAVLSIIREFTNVLSKKENVRFSSEIATVLNDLFNLCTHEQNLHHDVLMTFGKLKDVVPTPLPNLLEWFKSQLNNCNHPENKAIPRSNPYDTPRKILHALLHAYPESITNWSFWEEFYLYLKSFKNYMDFFRRSFDVNSLSNEDYLRQQLSSLDTFCAVLSRLCALNDFASSKVISPEKDQQSSEDIIKKRKEDIHMFSDILKLCWKAIGLSDPKLICADDELICVDDLKLIWGDSDSYQNEFSENNELYHKNFYITDGLSEVYRAPPFLLLSPPNNDGSTYWKCEILTAEGEPLFIDGKTAIFQLPEFVKKLLEDMMCSSFLEKEEKWALTRTFLQYSPYISENFVNKVNNKDQQIPPALPAFGIFNHHPDPEPESLPDAFLKKLDNQKRGICSLI